ncbi:MAG: YdcF family protein [Oscillospiraceae bacterium]|nr:YdcF family protein [Oscillospiraceae bacterium]
MRLSKRILWIVGLEFLALGLTVVLLQGGSFRLSFPADTAESSDAFRVTIDQEREVVSLTDQSLESGRLTLTFRSASPGRAFVEVTGPEGFSQLEMLYVHPLGVITAGEYFGLSSGAWIIPILVSVYIFLILLYVILKYLRGMKDSLYQYRNVRNLGWIIYFGGLLLGLIRYLISGDSIIGTVRATLNSASIFSAVAFPIAFVVSVLVTISNFRLIRREGRNWRNLLGLFLGILICAGTVVPHALSEFLQRTTLVDVHNERGAALYVEMAVTNTVLVTVTYLECILLSTVILSVMAARKIPAFDKDYILILGCQIRDDGTLTPLLKGRTDRALEFSRMQEAAAGYAPVFVPSGGKGEGEVIPEAEAIRNYLLEAGVPPERILMEDRSENTRENLENSLKLIAEHSEKRDPKIAFSTTNYHVFRAGILAWQMGIRAEGIGSGTRSYFWINAFVREFIATVYAERRKHLLVIAAMILLTLLMILTVYLSNTL